jgi:hypothetical protein
VWFEDDLGAQATSSRHGSVEVVDLKPQHDAMSWRRCGFVDDVGVVSLVPQVQLKKQLTRARDPIVPIAMGMFRKGVRSKQFGVPAATRPDVAYRDERLSLDSGFLRGDAHKDSPLAVDLENPSCWQWIMSCAGRGTCRRRSYVFNAPMLRQAQHDGVA